MALNIKLMIRKYGEDVQHKKKVTTDIGNGEEEISYIIQTPKRIQWIQITPYDEKINKFGKHIEADYLASSLPSTDINEYDLLYIDSHWCEVQNKIIHKTGMYSDYSEYLLRKYK